jgi:uncharacterized membrane protein YkoI
MKTLTAVLPVLWLFAYGASAKDAAKLTLNEAKVIALAARSGKITSVELEKESGGSGLRYSFDVHQAGRSYEIGVDANSGVVLENIVEGKNPD